MLGAETIWRAKTIVYYNHVELCKDSNPPNFLHFKVRQRAGNLVDVYRNKGEWSCNAVDKKADFGCIFFKGDHSKPFCSHTKAAEIYIKKEFGKKDRGEEN